MKKKALTDDNGKPQITNHQAAILVNTLVERARLLAGLGQQYGGDRDIYQALGYYTDLDYEKFALRYQRQDIAKAIVNRPVEDSWGKGFMLVESDEANDTSLEKAWQELDRRLGLQSYLMRIDKIAGIGKYGVLLLGLDDVKTKQDFANPVLSGKRKLLYVKPLGEGNAPVNSYESSPNKPRFGFPFLYDIKFYEGASQVTSSIHHSRVLHVPGGELLESDIEGVPRLEAVFNRLMDLEKLVGGSAEMFWRGARPGFYGKLDKGFTLNDTDRDTLQAQIDEYEHNLRRFLINEGIDLQALSQQVADPSTHVDIQLQMISAVTGIPKRILTGSELGELASGQDRTNWLSRIDTRRTTYIEQVIIRPFINLLIQYGVLPPAGKEGYSIQWPDLFAMSDEEQAKVGQIRADALSKYVLSPLAETVVPPDAFYKFFLGLDEEQINLITKIKEEAMKEEGSDETPEVEPIGAGGGS